MILGLGGWAESGKDEFADAMVKHNPLWVKTYMSYALELALLELDPYVPIFVNGMQVFIRYTKLHAEVGYTDSKKNPEVRRLLKKLGTEVGRKMFGENVWVDKMLEIVKQHELTIVTGIRFRNELDTILANQGITAWVSRPGVTPIDNHASDNSLGPEDFEVLIENNGTLDQLASLAAKFCDHITPVTR